MSHQTAREMALDLLLSITTKHAYSQIALNEALNAGQLRENDKRLVTTLVYGVLQQKSVLRFYLSSFVNRKRKLDAWVEVLLLLSIYQKVFLDRIPDHAIVNESVTIAKKRGHRGISGFVNGILRRLMREGVPRLSSITPEQKRLSIQYSHPEWLLKLWREQWGLDTAVKTAQADNQPPNLCLRVNRLKLSRQELMEHLAQEGIQTIPGTLSPDCVVVTSGNAVATAAFQKGWFTVQDESSMLVADCVGAEGGMLILDACAGPGGKTTHLGERMNNKGKILALDLHPHKTKLIDQAAKRLGLENIETRAMDARAARDTFGEAAFDRVLLDVPCSGLGVIRRKPEIKWSKTAEEISGLLPIQQTILEEAAPLVKPGGRLIYSTCTIQKEENEQQILAFLKRHPEYRTDSTLFERLPSVLSDDRASRKPGMIQIFPYQFDTDGFFICCLERKDN
ncbi:16S rRNA (cytosine(967)-C(5))-methyltransferase RsmB [Sporolactobacillus terrae]|uniref:16S rRNA (cytosine(967)-C(5))-methyltransferase n=1 Tax=Sporolactobacillus terrae TaxID=269673 RepID=A0A5K7WW76_9BACL|nr:16S rRNA (cytosine(967)-C(5))-methyltransferase RsmB [Sporolactobacillus terrae]UAK17091.1 16S rRNA (cytosine(967)-C(5))-methyltransferase RsmB [Sporolactobacillus terrae]BBN98617.1 ribosomal RNA small subunit methyltransferase B [Sporolactobacillus terrae]